MKVLIIEDETPAAEKLERYLHKFDPAIAIMAIVDNAAPQIVVVARRPDRKDNFFTCFSGLHEGVGAPTAVSSITRC